MMEKLPNILYKYINWSDKPRDKKKNILYKNHLYFSNPLHFNDPFDSMLPIIFDKDYLNSEKIHRDFLWINNVLGKTNYSEQQMDQIASDLFKNPKKIRYDTDIMSTNIQKSIIDKIRISCFTTKPDNILMWSHYADCHRGICIGFHTSLINDPSLVLCAKVNYSSSFPRLKKVTNIPLLLTKSVDWKYENEYRLINIDSHSNIEYPKLAINEVIIGHKMEDQLKDKLISYLHKKYPMVKILVSKPNQKKFKMDISNYS